VIWLHELDALFGKESDNAEEDIPIDWKIIMEEKVKSLKEEYSYHYHRGG
jgi:hypothetical protein